jgi:hypothetical protein
VVHHDEWHRTIPSYSRPAAISHPFAPINNMYALILLHGCSFFFFFFFFFCQHILLQCR